MKKEFGQVVSLPPFSGRLESEYNFPQFLEALLNCEILLDSSDCQILHQGRNRVGILALPHKDGGQVEIVVKEFCPRGIDRLKSLCLRGKALKAWSGAQALRARSIGTPFPVAYLEKRGRFYLEKGYFLSERVEGVEEIRFLFLKLPLHELQKLLSSLGAFLRSVHDGGILHRDLSDGNILVKMVNNETYCFYMIDTNRIKVKNRIGLFQRIKNLIRLGVPAQAQSIFLTQYLENPRIKRYLWGWYRVNKKTFSWYIGLKRKLRLRQLAQKLRVQ